MARTFVALGLFLATSIGFAGPAPAQYNNPQYNPQSQYNSPGTYQGYQGNQGYQGGQQGGYQGNQGYPGGQQGGYQGNQGYSGRPTRRLPRHRMPLWSAIRSPTEPLRYGGGRAAVMPGRAAIRPEPEPLRLHAAGRSDGAGAAPRTVTH
jgi:hypothetical protein